MFWIKISLAVYLSWDFLSSSIIMQRLYVPLLVSKLNNYLFMYLVYHSKLMNHFNQIARQRIKKNIVIEQSLTKTSFCIRTFQIKIKK
jgi:hypothetical protein